MSTLLKKAIVTAGKKIDCPLKNNCFTSSVVYNANAPIESDTTGKNYIRLTEGTFKQRYAQHKLSFRTETIQTARNYQNISTLNDYSTTSILQLTGVFWRQPRPTKAKASGASCASKKKTKQSKNRKKNKTKKLFLIRAKKLSLLNKKKTTHF